MCFSSDGKEQRKRRRTRSSSSSSTSSSSSPSSSSSSDEKRKRKKSKAKKKKLKKQKAKLKKQRKKEKKKLKKKEKKLKKEVEAMQRPPEKPPSYLEVMQNEEEEEDEVELGPVMTDEQKARLATKRPLTKEEYEARQSVIRRVVDPETGRTRLVRGEGEIIEEIVTREKHKEINKQTTMGDGNAFQRKLGMNR
uniref:ADP-ribosylation factor-like protein 6-interacting protein 4 n=1 Tax=Xiphophorus maculatus TaxID=8083 RepID=A0A3B5Q1Q6_XIPMA